MATKGIRVIAAMKLKGDKAKAMEIVKPLIEATRKEKGCIMYELFEKVKT